MGEDEKQRGLVVIRKGRESGMGGGGSKGFRWVNLKNIVCDIGKVTCLTLRFLRIVDSIDVRVLRVTMGVGCWRKLVETEKVKDSRCHRLNMMAMREKEAHDFVVNPQ